MHFGKHLRHYAEYVFWIEINRVVELALFDITKQVLFLLNKTTYRN